MGVGQSGGGGFGAGPAFEQEFTALADDAHLGSATGSALELGDRFDRPEIVAAQDDGQFVGGKSFSRSILQGQAL